MKLGEVIQVKAPSNIAILKYMGKKDEKLRIPATSSISLTLDSLCTIVEIRGVSEKGIRLVSQCPEVDPLVSRYEFTPPVLNKDQESRVKFFVSQIPVYLNAEKNFPYEFSDSFNFEIKTANSFPSGCGIASSASSFSALTLAVVLAACKDKKIVSKRFSEDLEFRKIIARIARMGSGSATRSFDGPWVGWQNENGLPLSHQMPELVDFIVVLDSKEKRVSSTEAHRRVLKSPLWRGRNDRTESRYLTLIEALKKGDIKCVSEITWREMWEMHSLFHTAQEQFSYWVPETVEVLNWVLSFLESAKRPPIVTMDAGPNVHILVPRVDADIWRERLDARFAGNIKGGILEDSQGSGPKILSIS